VLGEFGNVKANPLHHPNRVKSARKIRDMQMGHMRIPQIRRPPATGDPCYSKSNQTTEQPPVKAILCQRYGTPDDLVLADIPDPVAGPGEVVAKVVAAGLNFFDTLIIAGKYQTKPPFPFSPGGEFAGVVESVGAGVTEFKPGDRVLGYTNFNAARERTAVSVKQIAKITADLDFDRAAALTITYGTAYHALKHRALMRSGETLAVLGASGGVGLAAIELGRIMGAHVIACASTDDKLAFARNHGAHETVNYETENLRDALRRLGGEHGIDVVFDPVGGPFSEPAIRSLAWEGRHLVVGFAAGEIPKLPLNLVLLKNCAVLGVFWGAWVRHATADYKAALGELARWCAEGKLSCHIQEVYPLADTPKAIKALADRKVMGKLVVRP
jgi:NADPH2:quinone reductase